MSHIALVSFGKPTDAWAREEFGVYAKRLSALTEFSAIDLKGSRRSDIPSRLQEEAELFSKRFPKPQWQHIVLSEEGRLFNTVDFSKWLSPRLSRSLVFLVGSAYGIAPELRKSADLLWSLSPLTFTHEHARVLMAEQVYRCLQVLRGHPYHHL
ncbi:MAG TPA: 23S rRNA (pseudouridine(1915)-N(3))-methyltransferase RlmH [Fibrobacteraceae bacterium]|nr:23S rRNA (pseudouridine(1915)-N(3))-methyltransferase RlmH [Fibrobacteraceae bacterium]